MTVTFVSEARGAVHEGSGTYPTLVQLHFQVDRLDMPVQVGIEVLATEGAEPFVTVVFLFI